MYDSGLQPYSDLFYDHCGPIGSSAITPATRDVEVLTDYDVADLATYVQLQYTNHPVPPGTRELVYLDHLLTAGASVEVYGAYDYLRLYRITSSGEVVDIDTTNLTAESENTLQFRYSAYGVAVQEDHVIDAPISVHVETDSPGIMDACCSIAGPHETGLLLVALAFGLRRRRTFVPAPAIGHRRSAK